jgi:hypothetical protein
MDQEADDEPAGVSLILQRGAWNMSAALCMGPGQHDSTRVVPSTHACSHSEPSGCLSHDLGIADGNGRAGDAHETPDPLGPMPHTNAREVAKD